MQEAGKLQEPVTLNTHKKKDMRLKIMVFMVMVAMLSAVTGWAEEADDPLVEQMTDRHSKLAAT